MKSVGVLGVGSIADVYVRNAARMRNYRIVAVAGRDAGRTPSARGGLGRRGGDAGPADRPRRHRRHPQPDAAGGALRDHHGGARGGQARLLREDAGNHAGGSRALSPTMAEQRGLRLGVAPDTILGAGLQKARAMIDAGAIGRPLMATASILYHGADDWHPNPAFFYRAPGGGPVHDVGPYFLAALMALLGPIEQVYATGFRGFDTRTFTAEGPQKGLTVPVEVMTSVLALATFRSGVQATLTTSWDVWQNSQPDLEIHGTLGSLSLPHPNWHGGPLQIRAAPRRVGDGFARRRAAGSSQLAARDAAQRQLSRHRRRRDDRCDGTRTAASHVGGSRHACRRSRRRDCRLGAQRRACFPQAHAAAPGALRPRRCRPPPEGFVD